MTLIFSLRKSTRCSCGGKPKEKLLYNLVKEGVNDIRSGSSEESKPKGLLNKVGSFEEGKREDGPYGRREV